MNTKKWLALGLSVALAATAALAACAPEQPKEPDEGDKPSTPHTHTFTKWDYSDTEHWKVCPDDGELDVSSRAPHKVDKKTHTCECGYVAPHTHSYTQWAHDADQHWKVCPDDGAVDPDFPKADHSFDGDGKCECGYQKPEVYLVGMIASKPTSKLPNVWQQLGENVTEAVRKNCIKMELGEDGETYEVEVLLSKTDQIKVYDCSSAEAYPNNVSWVSVSEKNGYLVSWKPGDAEPTFRVHDHTFGKYASDAGKHWKVCTLDGTVEPGVEKQDHDFSNGDCVCGQKAPEACKHTNGYSFAYTELPEASAEGGTLQKTCPDCHDTQDVHYDKGLGTACNTGIGGKTVLTAGTYYLRGTNGFRFETTTAGTYTFRFEGKLIPTMADVKLHTFYIGSSYLSMFANAKCAIQACGEGGKYKEQIAAYDVQIDGFVNGQSKQFNSLTFTVKDTDVADGKKVCVQVVFYISSSAQSVNTDGYLITVECPAPAAAASAPAEVAMLPDTKH